MKANAKPVPVRSVVCLPRWMFVSAVTLCSALILACCVGAAYGALYVDGPQRWGWIGGCLGAAGGAAGGLFGTLCDHYRRLPAPALWWHLQHDAPTPFYRRVFWPALSACGLGLLLGLCWSHPVFWNGMVQTGGILAFLSGSQEAIRRHTTRQARALFALYADAALAAEDAQAIDDARAKDATFDAEIRQWQAMEARVRQLLAP